MWFFSLLLPLAFADVPRLSISQSDLSQVSKIYLAPGLVSLVEFPQNIIEVRVGSPHLVKALISQVSPKELTLYLNGQAHFASNLIVRSEKRIFVFDVIPSKTNHQDYIKIRGGAFGSPHLTQGLQHGLRLEISPIKIKQNLAPIVTQSKTLKVGP